MACASLIELDLSGCNVSDEGASGIFLALAEIASLKKLILKHAREISSVGWVACFQHLLDSQSALEILNFEGNSIDDVGATVLASLLGSHMSTVLTLNLIFNRSITTNGWRAFVNINIIIVVVVVVINQSSTGWGVDGKNNGESR